MATGAAAAWVTGWRKRGREGRQWTRGGGGRGCCQSRPRTPAVAAHCRLLRDYFEAEFKSTALGFPFDLGGWVGGLASALSWDAHGAACSVWALGGTGGWSRPAACGTLRPLPHNPFRCPPPPPRARRRRLCAVLHAGGQRLPAPLADRGHCRGCGGWVAAVRLVCASPAANSRPLARTAHMHTCTHTHTPPRLTGHHVCAVQGDAAPGKQGLHAHA